MSKDNFFLYPTKSRSLERSNIHTNDAGNFVISSISLNELSKSENEKLNLAHVGMGKFSENDIYDLSFKYKKSARSFISNELNYFIIVPTLRCNLTCSYCQVSRAAESAKGFDWNTDQFSKFVSFFSENAGFNPKVEIQGGEPLLIFDKLKSFIDDVFHHRPNSEIVICTNLQVIPKGFWPYVKDKNIFISTSIDGNFETHNRNRNQNSNSAQQFFENLNRAKEELGNSRVSALPTVTNFDELPSIIEAYKSLDILDVYLRPVNYQGFARKKFQLESNSADKWLNSYLSSLNYILEINRKAEVKVREENFAIHLKRIFNHQFRSHVDFRNPNLVGHDYLVVNYDGLFFPTDEARMLHRIGVVDLSIGDLDNGISEDKVETINAASNLLNYESCRSCAYLPFCGIDIVDILSRHGTLEVEMLNTNHCKTHMGIFDFIFKKLSKNDPNFIKNVNLHLTGKFEMTNLMSGLVHD